MHLTMANKKIDLIVFPNGKIWLVILLAVG